MRVFLGMILGAIITVVGAYSYDVLSGKAVMTDTIANSDRPLVNWDVVGRNWHALETNVRAMGQRVQDQWNKHAG